MGYSFTSPEVVRALVRAKRRGVDVRVVLDWKANTGKNNNASNAAMNLLASAADRSNSENVLVVWDDPVVAQKYLNHWTSRWALGTDWKQTY